jgi:hypothetical protein
MTVTRLKPSLHDRVSRLETRADGHDVMVTQFSEIYEAFTKAKTILGFFNWFWVKIVGGIFAALGGLAVVLTIVEKLGMLVGHR